MNSTSGHSSLKFEVKELKWFVFSIGVGLCAGAAPNILFILVDDLGWNDVSWHNPAMRTPHLGALATNHGVILDQHYAQPKCAPSRAALLTGEKRKVHTDKRENQIFLIL